VARFLEQFIREPYKSELPISAPALQISAGDERFLRTPGKSCEAQSPEGHARQAYTNIRSASGAGQQSPGWKSTRKRALEPWDCICQRLSPAKGDANACAALTGLDCFCNPTRGSSLNLKYRGFTKSAHSRLVFRHLFGTPIYARYVVDNHPMQRSVEHITLVGSRRKPGQLLR
jgi:hypothetical protein